MKKTGKSSGKIPERVIVDSDTLKKIGLNIVQQLKDGKIPSVNIPSRTSNNLVYDAANQYYVIGDQKINRSAGNIRHIKLLAQFLKVAWFCKDLVKQGNRHVTKRELYYISESWGEAFKFDEQPECDNVVEDVEAVIGRPREDFNVIPDNRGSIYGDISLRYKTPGGAEKTINCLDTPDGQSIGPRICEGQIQKVNADKVIAIETGGMYNRLMEEEAHKKFNAILIHTAGQAPRSTRRLIKRVSEENNLPVYIFCDSDPFGLHIAMVIIAGSAKSAHVNHKLATPKAQWLGTTATDITKYKLRSDKLRPLDIKRLDELKKDPRYKDDARMQKELQTWIKLGKKAEQQALLRYGFRFVVDEYLPAKLKELKAPGFR